MIILEDLNFQWEPTDVFKVKELWKQGEHLEVIAKAVARSEEETFLLLLHLARIRQVRERSNGILGKVS